jgi:hypothetical protein
LTLEETHEEDDIEATDEDDPSVPTAHAPRKDSLGRLSVDRQLLELEKRNLHRNPE